MGTDAAADQRQRRKKRKPLASPALAKPAIAKKKRTSTRKTKQLDDSASKLEELVPAIELTPEEQRKNEADTATHASLMANGASKNSLRKKTCFAFMKNGCPNGADCPMLHVGAPGSIRVKILSKAKTSEAAKWDPTRAVAPADRTELEKKRRKAEQLEKAAAAASDLNCQLYVKGIACRCTEKDVADAFEGFGSIVRVSKREGKDFAFVVFEEPKSVKKALAAANAEGRGCVDVADTPSENITVQQRVLHRLKGKSAPAV